ncbi:SIR2 family protein [Lactobacillus delbrueckii]|uniref:SIR2 family protein n=1 Tax=Lactobacillus delbrueckii TaxID=1584 RepID=UPI0011098DAA|nr:SIR2 family protein [Lactobacillus delbrueckii]TLQ28579.1 SIR2 family protein [Lactobacillus delbrueckii subsp. lactis]
MRCSFEQIRKAKNYLKIGANEQLIDNLPTEDMVTREKYKKQIEPWLSAALQSEHLSILLGAGLTTSVCYSAGVKSSSMATADFGTFSSKINKYADKAAKNIGRGSANIEDQIRTAYSLLAGYQIDGNQSAENLGKIIDSVLQKFSDSILASEYNIEAAKTRDRTQYEEALGLLESFLFTFASRTATRDRTHIFTTNYDRFIEYGCDLAGIKILDRFWGKIQPRFEESASTIDYYYRSPDTKNEFRYAEGVVRLTKLHGSVDWYEDNGIVYRDALRFGAKHVSLPSGKSYKDHLMIYPNSMKSVETAFYPYAELFRDFSTAICRPNSTIFTFGYGFGDTHINKIIKEMLSIPSTHLVIISFSVDERLIHFLKSSNMAQITVLAGQEFGSIDSLVKYYLPKAATDVITETASRLLDNRKEYTDMLQEGEKTDE